MEEEECKFRKGQFWLNSLGEPVEILAVDYVNGGRVIAYRFVNLGDTVRLLSVYTTSRWVKAERRERTVVEWVRADDDEQ